MSHHDIAGIWVAFVSRYQRYRCQQDAGAQSPRLNTDFVRLVDKTKRQRQMKRPLTPEEKELVRAAVAVGVPADTLSESELLTFDCAGEWV